MFISHSVPPASTVLSLSATVALWLGDVSKYLQCSLYAAATQSGMSRHVIKAHATACFWVISNNKCVKSRCFPVTHILLIYANRVPKSSDRSSIDAVMANNSTPQKQLRGLLSGNLNSWRSSSISAHFFLSASEWTIAQSLPYRKILATDSPWPFEPKAWHFLGLSSPKYYFRWYNVKWCN